jgi:hypothetical protein
MLTQTENRIEPMNFTFDLKQLSAVVITNVGNTEVVNYITDYLEELFRRSV